MLKEITINLNKDVDMTLGINQDYLLSSKEGFKIYKPEFIIKIKSQNRKEEFQFSMFKNNISSIFYISNFPTSIENTIYNIVPKTNYLNQTEQCMIKMLNSMKKNLKGPVGLHNMCENNKPEETFNIITQLIEFYKKN